MNAENLVGIAEIASLAEVTKQVVSNWRRRYDGFPKAIQNLESGPVWNKEAIESWLKQRKGEATHVLSFINLKGGVGKTTTAVGVAEVLAQEHKKRVLVIDLDPQTNATVTLIKEEKWAEMDSEGRTIAQLFLDKLNPHLPPKFDIEQAIARQVSTINDGIARLDLLPSSIRLISIQDQVPLIAMQNDGAERPVEILKNAIEPILGAYDYIIIDCPPSLGVVTKNGLRISSGYIIPTIPDVLSTWGIYQIVENVEKLARASGISIPPLGIVATKVQGNNLHSRVIDDLRNRRLGNFAKGSVEQPQLFKSSISQAVDVARGADVDADKRTFKGKYGSKAYAELQGLTLEILQICEKKN
ncbi:MAG: AAA family ATPase [Verrucomicrobiaceae bacterium]|jgi:chromosome partitioning protein